MKEKSQEIRWSVRIGAMLVQVTIACILWNWVLADQCGWPHVDFLTMLAAKFFVGAFR